ncbi:MAG: restriction endonuclease [Chloroflexi bacterium]|nr:restriction endonuclease [Chloroflexota bacterium]
MSTDWQRKLEEYCQRYNIPIEYLAEILYEPKVTPMIRGKGFEYTVLTVLQDYLPDNEWRVSKAAILDEISFHDTDIRVFHKRTGKVIRVECKLADKEGYRLRSDGDSEIRVKCMRSRTLGTAKVKELAPKLGVSEESLSIHNDQYVPADFDIVVTTIGNAFYRTDSTTGLYECRPTEKENDFLQKLKAWSDEDLKGSVFRSIYVARTQDLAARSETGVVCTRRRCTNKTDCGFIPNYPVIHFDGATNEPVQPWVAVEGCV